MGLPEPKHTTIDLMQMKENQQKVLGLFIGASLTKQERWIVDHSCGYFGARKMSNKEMATACNIPVEKVEEIRARAIRKIISAARRQIDKEENK